MMMMSGNVIIMEMQEVGMVVIDVFYQLILLVLKWTKVSGKESNGSIMIPSESGWDCVQTGLGNVI